MSGKGAGDADLSNMGAFDFSALQGVLNVRHVFGCSLRWRLTICADHACFARSPGCVGLAMDTRRAMRLSSWRTTFTEFLPMINHAL